MDKNILQTTYNITTNTILIEIKYFEPIKVSW
jgi:hypothetical protein